MTNASSRDLNTHEFIEVFGCDEVGAMTVLLDLLLTRDVVIVIIEVVSNRFQVRCALLEHT